MLYEVITFPLASEGKYYSDTYENEPGAWRPARRHNGFTNVLFLGGGAEEFRTEEIRNNFV